MRILLLLFIMFFFFSKLLQALILRKPAWIQFILIKI